MRKMICASVLCLGIFALVGIASASTADVLQPASATTNMESLRVGVAGQGGVTFFNGTVLNEGDDPFTVGDDVRIDGGIWRGSSYDNQAVQIFDDLLVDRNLNVTGDISVEAVNANYMVDTHKISADEASIGTIYTRNMYTVDTVYAKDLWADDTIYATDLLVDYINYAPASPDFKPGSANPAPAPISDNGSIQSCTPEHYGQLIFSDKSIDGGLPNQFYGCTGTGWKQL